jgi:hypothetical protein
MHPQAAVKAEEEAKKWAEEEGQAQCQAKEKTLIQAEEKRQNAEEEVHWRADEEKFRTEEAAYWRFEKEESRVSAQEEAHIKVPEEKRARVGVDWEAETCWKAREKERQGPANEEACQNADEGAHRKWKKVTARTAYFAKKYSQVFYSNFRKSNPNFSVQSGLLTFSFYDNKQMMCFGQPPRYQVLWLL